MSDLLRLGLAQLNLTVGDVPGNTAIVVEAITEARNSLNCDVVVFPELTLSGYPPEDLLFHAGFRRQIAHALDQVRNAARDIGVLVGYPEYANQTTIYNSAAFLADGEIKAVYRKQCLPNYSVFDEKRYFQAGHDPVVVTVGKTRIGLTVCEDIWEPEPVLKSRDAGAELVIAINGSPYAVGYQLVREKVIADRIRSSGLPMVYLNYVGGQDELVFDGSSLVMDAQCRVTQRAPAFEEGMIVAEFDVSGDRVVPLPGMVVPHQTDEESIYNALVLGTRDYVHKHGFPGVVMGLSGGIDSALTLAVAVDALSADRVRAIMMPSRYTADISKADAAIEAERLGVRYDVIAIEGIYEAVLAGLKGQFVGTTADATEENIQSRARGILLMAISNKTGDMLLTTGNKSELAVGYATLYGDMAGGFDPIKDCSKTMVYRLARYRNSIAPVIPERVITRAPSAELRENQQDTDSLPPYEILDPILEAFIEEDCSVEEIVMRGFEKATVGRILDMVKRNEYKRRQAPPGIRISNRAFGRDWRYPITSGYHAW